MKQIILAFAFFVTSAILVLDSANAKDGFYIGADISKVEADHKHSLISETYPTGYPSAKPVSSESSAKSTGFSGQIGYKFQFSRTYIAPEVFYDYLNNSAKDFYINGFYDTGVYFPYPEGYKNRINIKDRFGAKVNLGFNLTKEASVFVNAGLASVKYVVSWPSVANTSNTLEFGKWTPSYGVRKIAAIYGLGASYALNKNWALRFSYDYQKFAAKYIIEGWRDSITIETTKLGMVYSF